MMAPGAGARRGSRAERLFLEMLRPDWPRGFELVSADELQEAAALAFEHRLFLLVDRRIREHADVFPPGTVAGGYEKASRLRRLRHISQALNAERAEQEVLSLLEAAAVPLVVLKGSSLSVDLYGDPHCRTSVDVDLLVRPADVPAADAALVAAGYRRDNDRPLSFWMRRLHHAVYQRPGCGQPVEIHWNFSIPGFFNLDPAEIWAGVELTGLRGRLQPAMTLTLLLMHHHLHGCADLRTLVDLVWAFDRHPETMKKGLYERRLHSIGLLVVAGIASRQAEKLWGAQPWHPGSFGSSHALRSFLLASAAGAALRPGRRPRGSDRFLHAAVHRLGLDSPRRVIASIAKTLLPSAADMRALTGEERSGLAGYVRYFRWRIGGQSAASEKVRRRRQ